MKIMSRLRLAYRWLLCLCAVTGCLTLAGCGRGDGLDRREVRGSVTLDGEPIEKGHITLFPLGAGPVASGTVERGGFWIGESDGPIPGEYRVEITGTRETGKMLTIENPGGEPREVPEVVSIVPVRYNERSELTLSVGQNDLVVEKTFELTTAD